MYYNIESWQKLGGNVYDAGGKIVFIKQPFLASVAAMMIGGIAIGASVITVISGIQDGELTDEPSIFLLVWAATELLVGLFLLMNGLRGRRERKEQGGIHPKDSLYFLDRQTDTVTKHVEGMENMLAKLSEVTFKIKKDSSSKSTRYELKMFLPNKLMIQIFEHSNRATVENMLNEIKTRLALTDAQILS